ncbi:MAG: hypothetical protein LUH00_04295 [Lachnospiraceae bacterium]|nr:hypothetical protein [Lachnospiraceae bacterium]
MRKKLSLFMTAVMLCASLSTTALASEAGEEAADVVLAAELSVVSEEEAVDLVVSEETAEESDAARGAEQTEVAAADASTDEEEAPGLVIEEITVADASGADGSADSIPALDEETAASLSVSAITTALLDASAGTFTTEYEELKVGDMVAFTVTVTVDADASLSFDTSCWSGDTEGAVTFTASTTQGPVVSPVDTTKQTYVVYVTATLAMAGTSTVTFAYPGAESAAVSTEVTAVDTTEKKAIIVVPGIAGSELVAAQTVSAGALTIPAGTTVWSPTLTASVLSDSAYLAAYAQLLADTTNVTAKTVSATDESIGANGTYTALVHELYEKYDTANGGEYEVQFFSYDWRTSIADGATALYQYIEAQGYTDVVLVCHSMGGLVAGAYIGTTGGAKVEKLITIGTPYQGAPQALYVMETGAFLEGTTGILTKSLFKSAAQSLMTVYELLPTTEYLAANSVIYSFTDYSSLVPNGQATGVTEMTAAYSAEAVLALISSRYSSSFYAVAAAEMSAISAANPVDLVDSYVIVGTGEKTVSGIGVSTEDGSLEDISVTTLGDGTVPLYSATLGGRTATGTNGNSIRYVSAEHSALVQSATTYSLIDAAMAGTWSETSASSAGSDLSALVKIRLEGATAYTITDANSTPLLYVTADNGVWIADGYEECFYFLGDASSSDTLLGTLCCFLDAGVYQILVSASGSDGFVCDVIQYSDYSTGAIAMITEYGSDGAAALIVTGQSTYMTDADGDGTPETPVSAVTGDGGESGEGSETAQKDGLTLDEDGIFRYYQNGTFAEDYSGVTAFDGGLFFIRDGLVDTDANGLCLYEDVWYFAAFGQVQLQYTGLALYDEAWFYITNGILDSSKNGLVEYDGETFLAVEGRLLLTYSGLWLNSSTIGGDDLWYFIGAGMVQKVSQVVLYDGEYFVVTDGVLDTDYNGTIEYHGTEFTVVAGQLYA